MMMPQITILRVGLKSTDLITDGGEICGNTYHPAFRQLVEGEIAKETLEAQLIKLLESESDVRNGKPTASRSTDCGADSSFTFYSNDVSFSNMIGNAKKNKLYFAEKYPAIKIKFKVDSNLEDRHYAVVKY